MYNLIIYIYIKIVKKDKNKKKIKKFNYFKIFDNNCDIILNELKETSTNYNLGGKIAMDNEKKVNKKSKTNNKTTQKKGNGTKKNTNNKQKNLNVTKKTNNNKMAKKDSTNVKKENIQKKDKVEEIKDEKIDNEETIVSTEEEGKTNKVGVIVLLAILLIIIGICIFYQVDNKDSEASNEASTEESNEAMDDFYKYFNSKNTKIIYYASSQCGYCELETPIMEQIKKDYDIDYLYIDSLKLTKTDKEKMLKELDIEHATPTTIVVKNGKILDTQVGYVDGGEMVNFLKENKLLKEDAVYTPEQYITFINYEEYNKLLKEEGKQVITIGQTGCSHCIATKPVLNSIAKDYNITVNYLNITEMTQSERDSLTNSLSEIGYDEEEFVSNGNFGTPLTLIIENGKVISYIDGERPTAKFIKALKNANVISE